METYYQLRNMPFTRSTRPLMTHSAAKHMLDEHAYDSTATRKNGQPKDRFPKGTFGPDDDNIELAMDMVNELTLVNEPRWANQEMTALYFDGKLGGVSARVPVRLGNDGQSATDTWAPRTGFPINKDYGKGGEYDSQVNG